MTNKNSITAFTVDYKVDSLAKPEVLALDLDLTLHDVISHYNASINHTIIHFGQPPLTKEDFKEIGVSFVNTRQLISKFLPLNQVEEAFEYYLNHFLSREIPVNSLFPGAESLLRSVKHELKIPIIGITNSEEIIGKKILNDLGVLEFFDYVIGIKDDNLPKPHTQMLFTALSLIHAEAGPHIWFVGDRHTDTQCAKAGGCTAIRFYHKHKPIDENADFFINCHYNLFEIMKAKL
jgi:phosphoglycolate phosphatase